MFRKPFARYILGALLALIVTSGARAFVVDDAELNGVLYLLETYPGPPHQNRILRFDLTTNQWLSPIDLPSNETLRAIAVHPSGIFVSFDFSTRRYSLDGTTSVPVVTTPSNIGNLLWLGDVLVIVSGWSPDGGLQTVNPSSLALLDTASTGHEGYCYGASAAPALGKILCLATNQSPKAIFEVNIDAAGNIGTADSPNHDDYPLGSRTWMFPDNARFADDEGNVFSATSLHQVGSIGAQLNVLAFSGDRAVALRNSRLVAYSGDLLETGSYQLNRRADTILARDGKIYAFAEDDGAYHVEIVPLSSFAPDPVAPRVDPAHLDFTPDAYQFDTGDGVLYLLSRSHTNIFRWSVSQGRYLESIPLAAAPDFMSLDPANDNLYLAHADGKINKLPIATGQEQHIATMLQPPYAMAQVGAGIFLVAPLPATHYMFSSTGQQLSAVDERGYSHEFIWNDAAQSLFWVGDTEIPRSLKRESIDPVTGHIGTYQAGPGDHHEAMQGVVRVHPDGSVVLLGSGSIFDASTFDLVDELPHTVTDAAWLGATLWTLAQDPDGTTLEEWSSDYASERILQMTGAPLRVFRYGAGLLIVRMFDRRPVISFFDTVHPPDADRDGIDDFADNCPAAFDPAQSDLDGDGIGNGCDFDIDDDGYGNDVDVFPLDATEHSDLDHDGLGDNADPDNDNDGTADNIDLLPDDPAIQDTLVPEAFFPLNAGAGWVYEVSGGFGQFSRVSESPDVLINGIPTRPLNYGQPGFLNFFAFGESGLEWHRQQYPDTVIDFMPAQIVVPRGFRLQESTVQDGTVSVTVADLGTQTLQYSVTTTFDEMTELTVNAGHFRTAKLRAQHRVVQIVNGVSSETTWTETMFLAKNVGIVMATSTRGFTYQLVHVSIDDDSDGRSLADDNCPLQPNADQADFDGDRQGDACDADDDGDGVADTADAFPHNATETGDFDGDGIGDQLDLDDDNDSIPDIVEQRRGLNPRNTADAFLDPDGDGLTNIDEIRHGTDPHLADSDGDGSPDGAEVARGTDPRDDLTRLITFIVNILLDL